MLAEPNAAANLYCLRAKTQLSFSEAFVLDKEILVDVYTHDLVTFPVEATGRKF